MLVRSTASAWMLALSGGARSCGACAGATSPQPRDGADKATRTRFDNFFHAEICLGLSATAKIHQREEHWFEVAILQSLWKTLGFGS